MLYPERQPVPTPAADRLLAGAGFALQRFFARHLSARYALAEQVLRHVENMRGTQLAESIPALRYRVRRAGFTPQTIAECFGAYCAALAQSDEQRVAPETLGAARWLLAGGVAELAHAHQRMHAVALAAFARALHGSTVHVLTASEAAAQALAAAMRPVLGALGLEAGCVGPASDSQARRKAYACHVTCAPMREAGLDYLRDRAAAGGRPGALRGRLERLAAGRGAAQPLALNGLQSALVLDADQVMLDEARVPIVVAREVDRAQERLMYEQAMELARALTPEEDFRVDAEGVALSEPAAALLARLATPLGGAWAAAERREELVRLALEVLHALERDVHYRVEEGRVLLPQRPPEESEAHAARDAILQMLIEVKEGCRTSTRREVVARISVPAFLGRYLHLGGVCADARGLESELWKLYGLKTALAGRREQAPLLQARIFAATAQKQAALVEEAQRAAAAASTALVAVRSPAGAKAVGGLMAGAGISGAIIARYPTPAALPPGRPVSVLVAELHDARRHVAQLCTMYDTRNCRVLLALDEEAVVTALGEGVARRLARLATAQGELPPRLSAVVARLAQRGTERAQAALRQDVSSRDQYLRDLLAFSGEGD